MEKYKNLGRNSGVFAYECGTDFIWVQFSKGGRYLYNYASTGSDKVEHMKQLAVNGQGLNTFINQHVGQAYADKKP